MTSRGVEDLYDYLGAAWPLIIRPGVRDEWKRAKIRELYQTYREYSDMEVLEAFQKWTEENEKFPTTHNIINEIKWAQRQKRMGHQENEELWPMDVSLPDGTDATYGLFKRSDFVEHPKNPEHLQPEEWNRRYRATRRRNRQKMVEAWGGSVDYEAGARIVAGIRARVMGGSDADLH